MLPLQAKWAHKSAIIRSVHHRAPCHDSGPQTLFSGHEQLTNTFNNNTHTGVTNSETLPSNTINICLSACCTIERSIPN